uniref:TFIIS N-terminal domain-containing protein n=1 Tax=Athene cunicularia TaxID=194338 RepID=A0A663LM46_ATHCN
MTIQLLQTTRIGVAVNSVRKHCSDEEVVTSAKILIKNWKRLLGDPNPPQKDVDGKKEKDMDGEKEKKEKGLDFPNCPNEGVKHPKSSVEKHREKHKERWGLLPAVGVHKLCGQGIGGADTSPSSACPLLVIWIIHLCLSTGAGSTAGDPKGSCLQPGQHQGSFQRREKWHFFSFSLF